LVLTPPRGLTNADFEGPTWTQTRYYLWPWHNAYTTPFTEINPPTGWVAWWVENRFCTRFELHKSGRPEVTLIHTYQDTTRVSSGDTAKWFTFWRCHLGGLYQTTNVHPGAYQFCVDLHYWYTDCSFRPNDPPYESNCITPADWALATLHVGIDPTGGQDYFSPAIAWSQPAEIYGRFRDSLCSPLVSTTGEQLTVWIKGETQAPLKHCDLYADNAILHRAQPPRAPSSLPETGAARSTRDDAKSAKDFDKMSQQHKPKPPQSQPNVTRLEAIWSALLTSPGLTLPALATQTGLRYGYVCQALVTLENNGYFLAEDEVGQLFPFRRNGTFYGED
jgi:hypothetical protein